MPRDEIEDIINDESVIQKLHDIITYGVKNCKYIYNAEQQKIVIFKKDTETVSDTRFDTTPDIARDIFSSDNCFSNNFLRGILFQTTSFG